MALFNESLVARFNRQISRMHGIKGPGAPAPQVSPEITHDIVLENDRFENRVLGGTNSFAVLATGAAVVGQNSGVGLRNPAGSNALVVVTGFGPSGNQSALTRYVWSLRASIALGVTAATSIPPADTRVGIVLNSAGQVLTLANAGVLGTFFVWGVVAPAAGDGGVLWSPLRGIVLAPGFDLLGWNATTVNASCEMTYEWYERGMEPSEVALGP